MRRKGKRRKTGKMLDTVKKRRKIRRRARAKVKPLKARRRLARIKRRKRAIVPQADGGPTIGNTRVIVYIPFNNLNVRSMLPRSIYEANLPEENTHLTPDWINKRIDIFMRFTLKSLLNQTNPNYAAFIVYDDSSRAYIDQALSNYSSLPYNIRFIANSEYESAVMSLLNGYSYWYELHLYSDDMYSKYYIDMLYNYKPKPETKVLVCQNGYIYNSVTNELAKYFNHSSSFNCLIYRVQDYMNGVRHNLFQTPPRHKEIKWEGAVLLPHEIIRYPVYVNHSHSNNSAFFFSYEMQRNSVPNVWENTAGKKVMLGEFITNESEKARILEEFIGNPAA
ncbi:glycosyltransferase [Paenibacillus harenae]|uniref:glycosyltransferase n=1 Tax=Paenibacillus harenae TaxID=306543 RepID=UPI0027917CF9|nr:glycosyltransferase [Paenibacillus harenae]MDQ0058845.1 hypothetical protein [Paenibacillus harenae]